MGIGPGAGSAWNQQVAVGGHTVLALPATDNPTQEGKLLASWKKRCCHCGYRALLELIWRETRVKTASQAGRGAWGAPEHEGVILGHRCRAFENT